MAYTFIFDELHLTSSQAISNVISNLCSNFKMRISGGDLLFKSFGYEENEVEILEGTTFSVTKTFNKEKFQNIVGNIILSLENIETLKSKALFDIIGNTREKAAITIQGINYDKAQEINNELLSISNDSDLIYEGYIFIDESKSVPKVAFIDRLLLDAIFDLNDIYVTEDSFLDFSKSVNKKVNILSKLEFNKKEKILFGDYSTYLNEIIDIDRKKPLKFSSLYQAILNAYSEGKFKGVENFHLTLSGILDGSTIHDDKLSKYLLNMEHERGKDKAKFFKNALGIELKDKQYLAGEILKKINFGEFKDVSFVQNPQYEQLRFVTSIIIEGRNGEFVSIDTVWQITENESPVLITAYPTHKKTVQ